MTAPLDSGTRIRFLVTLEEGPDEFAPGKLFCTEGEEGVITAVHKLGASLFDYSAKTDSWPNPFLTNHHEFEVIE